MNNSPVILPVVTTIEEGLYGFEPLFLMNLEKPTTKTVSVDSTPSGLNEFRQWLLSQLDNYKYCEDDVFAIRLALEEAFYNAVKHGNKMDPTKKVFVDASVGPDRVEITMSDTGEGFDPNSVPDCRAGENLYKTEGRGLLLMRSYMDIVEFNEKGNSVHMVRYKRQQPDPHPNNISTTPGSQS